MKKLLTQYILTILQSAMFILPKTSIVGYFFIIFCVNEQESNEFW